VSLSSLAAAKRFSPLGFRLVFYSLLVSVALLLQHEVEITWIYAALALYFFSRLPGIPTKVSPPLALSAAFCCLYALSIFSAYETSAAAREFLRYGFLLLIYLDLRDPRGETSTESIFLVCLIIAVLMGVGGIYQVFLSEDPMPLSWAATPGVEAQLKRAFGLFDNPNLFGTFLFLCLIPTLYLSLEKGRKILFPVALLLLGVLLLTQSRGAILATGISFVFLVISCKSRNRIVMILMLIALIGGFFLSGRSKSLAAEDLGINQRWELMIGSMKMLKEHWVRGVSPGSFYLTYPYYRTVGGYYPLHVHNHFLEVFIETGIIGALLLIGFCLSLIYGFFRQEKSLWPLAFFLGILCNSMTNQAFSFFPQNLIALAGLLLMTTPSTTTWKSVSNFWLLVFFPLAFLLFTEFQKSSILSGIADSKNLRPEAYPAYLRSDLLAVTQITGTVLNREEPGEEDLRNCLKWLLPMVQRYPFEGEIPFLAYSVYRKLSEDSLAQAMLLLAMQRDSLSEKYAVSLMNSYLKRELPQEAVKKGEAILLSNPGYRKINPWYDRIQELLLKAYLAGERYEDIQRLLSAGIWVDEKRGKLVARQYKELLP
jgi:O-antigen ligase